MPKYANLETLQELLVATKGYVDENVRQKMDAFNIGDGLTLEDTTLSVTATQLSDLTALGVASQADLDTEISDRTSADAALREAIDAEVTAREDAIAALDYADAAVAKSFVTSVSETDGVVSVTKGAVTSTDSTVAISSDADGGIDLAANIDGSTIVKDDSGVLSVASSALTQYVGKDAISVSAADSSNNKTVSLGIASGDVLSQSDSGLAVTLGLSWDSSTKKISLTGIDGATIASVDASDFVIDGMLEDASYDSGTQVLTLTVNTGTATKTVDVDLSSLVDVYTNSDGSLSISGNVINHANAITAGTTASTATGTLAHGGSFVVPTVTYDKFGHVTATSSVTLTLPAETTLSKGTEATATATLEHGGTFAAYTAVSVSGHAITPTKTTFTLPAASSLADLGGVGTVTASGDDCLTLTATKSGTAVTISGTVDVMTADEVSALYGTIYA